MDFLNKCSVLGDLWAFYREDIVENEAWMDFFKYNDVALPLTYMIDRGYASIIESNEEGVTFVNETWDMFCDYIDIDPEGEYENIGDAFAASSQPPLAPASV